MNSDFFLSRATVRRYSDKPISDAEITGMLEEATHAPNTGNMQWYSVVVTRSEEGKEALSPLHFNQPQVKGSQAILTFCVDLNRFEKWCRQNDAEPGYENLQSLVAAMIDCSLFAQQFCTIAEMRGIGTCYLGTTAYNADKIAEVLALPERVFPLISLSIGYPADTNKPSLRLPVDAIIHKEKYSEPTSAEINEWYRPLEEESAHFVDENKKETLAQVFTDIRYPKSSNELFSKTLHDFLVKNKFL